MDDKEKYKWEGVQAVIKWLAIMEAEGHGVPGTAFDFESCIENSELLKRLISNQIPCSIPPPLSFARPNYQLMDSGNYHPKTVREDGLVVVIDEIPWQILEQPDENTWLLRYRIYRGKKGSNWSQSVWKLHKKNNRWIIEKERDFV